MGGEIDAFVSVPDRLPGSGSYMQDMVVERELGGLCSP